MVIRGTRSIGRYCGVTPVTVLRWINLHGFPVCKRPDGSYMTTEKLINDWVLARRAEQIKDGTMNAKTA